VKNFISQAFLAISLIILTLAGGFGVGVSAQSDVNDRQERAEIADSPTLDFSTPPVDTYLLNDEGEKTPADLNTCATDSSGNLYCARGNNFYSCRDVDNGPRGEDEYICNPVPLEGINSSSTEVEFSQAGRQATETYESRNNSRKFSATDIGVRVNNLGINGQVYDDLNGNCDSATDICRVECPAGGIQGACQEGEVIWMYECQNERSSNNTRVREFTCNKWAQFDGAQPTLADLDGSSESGDIETTNANNPGGDGKDNFFEVLFNIVMTIVAIVLYGVSFIVLVILFFFSWFVLVILGINPAGGDFLGAIQPAWGAVVGLANLLVLAAFMYVGFAYLLGLESVKKNVGDFILKVVYYALLLNFTLLGAAAFVNIGYGVGNLIKFAYAGGADTSGTNQALVGDLIEGIGRISYLRCGNEFSNGEECNISNSGFTESAGRVGRNIGTLFNGELADSLTAVISEALVVVAGLFAIVVMFRVLKIVLLRLMGLIFIMILSPIGLASYFSPVDSWKEIGKQMLQRLWQFVAFYPAFIMALVLVNLISGSFADIIMNEDTTAGITQSLDEAFQADTTVSDSTEDNQATVGLIRAETLQNTFTQSIKVMLVLVLSLGGLWAVTEYFVKKFEEDLKKVTDGAVNAYKSGIAGFKSASRGLYTLSAPARGVASMLGVEDKLKNSGIYKNEKFGINALKKSDNFLSRGLGNALDSGIDTVGSALTGRTLIDLERKGKMAKNLLYDSWVERGKADIARREGEQDANNSIALKELVAGTPGEKLMNELFQFTDDSTRGLSGSNLKRKRKKGEVDKLIKDRGSAAAQRSFQTDVMSRDIMLDILREGAFGDAYKMENSKGQNEDLYSAFNEALKRGDTEALNLMSSSGILKQLFAKGLSEDFDFSDEAKARMFTADQQLLPDYLNKDGSVNENSAVAQKLLAAATNAFNPTSGLDLNDLFDPRLNDYYKKLLNNNLEPGSDRLKGALAYADRAKNSTNSVLAEAKKKYGIPTFSPTNIPAIQQLMSQAQLPNTVTEQNISELIASNEPLKSSLEAAGQVSQQKKLELANQYVQVARSAQQATATARNTELQMQIDALQQVQQAGGIDRLSSSDRVQATKKAGASQVAKQVQQDVQQFIASNPDIFGLSPQEAIQKGSEIGQQVSQEVIQQVQAGASNISDVQSAISDRLSDQFKEVAEINIVQGAIQNAVSTDSNNTFSRAGEQMLSPESIDSTIQNIQAAEAQIQSESIRKSMQISPDQF
jgi:hypothetical protein